MAKKYVQVRFLKTGSGKPLAENSAAQVRPEKSYQMVEEVAVRMEARGQVEIVKGTGNSFSASKASKE